MYMSLSARPFIIAYCQWAHDCEIAKARTLDETLSDECRNINRLHWESLVALTPAMRGMLYEIVRNAIPPEFGIWGGQVDDLCSGFKPADGVTPQIVAGVHIVAPTGEVYSATIVIDSVGDLVCVSCDELEERWYRTVAAAIAHNNPVTMRL